MVQVASSKRQVLERKCVSSSAAAAAGSCLAATRGAVMCKLVAGVQGLHVVWQAGHRQQQVDAWLVSRCPGRAFAACLMVDEQMGQVWRHAGWYMAMQGLRPCSRAQGLVQLQEATALPSALQDLDNPRT